MEKMTFEEAVTKVLMDKKSIPVKTTITDFDRSKYSIIQECENYKMYDYAPGVMIIEEFPERECSYLAVLDSDGDDIGELGYCLTKTDCTTILS